MNKNISGDSTKAQQTKEKIFMVAARLFAEKGYNGVSMREISELSGVTKPTIYYYFVNKEGIYSSLLDASIESGRRQLHAIADEPGPIKIKLIKIVKQRFQLAIEKPEFTKFVQTLFTSSAKLPFLDRYIEEAKHERRRIADLIQKGINSGEFGATANPALACEIFIGTISHFIWKQLNGDQMILSDDLAEAIVELLFKGLNE